MKDKIFVTGARGFLLSHLIPFLNAEIFYTFKRLEDITEDDMNHCCTLMHFASPSDSVEFSDHNKTMNTMISGSINVFDIAIKRDMKIIFASSEAIYDLKTDNANIYALNKLTMEQYITKHPSLILRIPRVYGKDRKKGLMRKLQEGTFIGDKSQIIEYQDIDDWVSETISIINKVGVYEYENKISNTVAEIEAKYNKDEK